MAMTGKFWGLEEPPTVRETMERPRKNTVERFNDELSVLERPLEGDVEYYDETPPPSRWRRWRAFVLVAGLTCGGSLFAMRHFSQREAVAQSSPLPAAIAAPAVAAPTVAPPSPPSSSDRATPPTLAAADPATAAEPELGPAANGAPAARPATSVKPTHGSRHSHHGDKSGTRHHGRHQHN